MATLQERGAAALVRRMKASAGVAVTYTRTDANGSNPQTVALTAWVGNTLYARNTQEPGASVIWGERDYFFAAADLVLGGSQTTPQKGDTITGTIDGVATTFGLSTPTGEPVWRYSDQTRQIIRAHCKRV